jgi:ABC-2 type transport system permease protein
MAVYKRTYKTYNGPRTAAWSRFLILTRFSWARLFQSKLLVLFMAACLFYPLACAVFIYISHNDAVLGLLSLSKVKMPEVDGKFFYTYCTVQGVLAYLLTALTGPSLVSPDLANGALPLYFSRPFSRSEYVAGKMALLLSVLALITWVPALVLFAIKSSLSGWSWAASNLWLAGGFVFGLLIWSFILSLIALAISAWVKWRIAAGAMVLAVFFAGTGFGSAINAVMRTEYGALISLTRMMRIIWADLLRYDNGAQLTAPIAWAVLALACLACVWLLAKRVRPFEVVK